MFPLGHKLMPVKFQFESGNYFLFYILVEIGVVNPAKS